MNDPFSVLGISSSASEDEIKKAYRQKCKQYHPDLNPNDPAAEEKFKQVQTAYSDIMKIKSGGAPSGAGASSYGSRSGASSQYQQESDPFGFGFGFGFDPFGFGFGGQQQYSPPQETPEMQAANNYIRNGHYREALNALGEVPSSERTARWYYYAALAHSGLGDQTQAAQYARTAAEMEPGSYEYKNLYDRLSGRGTSQNYQNYQNYQGYQSNVYRPCGSASASNWCWYMILLNCLCNCCCGGRGFY